MLVYQIKIESVDLFLINLASNLSCRLVVNRESVWGVKVRHSFERLGNITSWKTQKKKRIGSWRVQQEVEVFPAKVTTQEVHYL